MIIFFFALFLPVCTAFRVCNTRGSPRGARFALGISRHDIYRLRRQKEILDAMSYILERHDKLPIGKHIQPEVIEGISLVEVELNSDCSHARLKICIAGDAFQQRQGFSWLEKNSKYLRYRMAQMLSHRKNVPAISFHRHNFVQQAEILMKMNEHMLRARSKDSPPSDTEDHEELENHGYKKLLLV